MRLPLIMFRHTALYGAVNIKVVPAVDSTPLTRDRPASRHTVVAPFPFCVLADRSVRSRSLFPSWLRPRIGVSSLLPPSTASLHNNFAMSSFDIGILLSSSSTILLNLLCAVSSAGRTSHCSVQPPNCGGLPLVNADSVVMGSFPGTYDFPF